jgi:hypothetical protein
MLSLVQFVGMFIISLHTKFYISSLSGPLVTVKLKAKWKCLQTHPVVWYSVEEGKSQDLYFSKVWYHTSHQDSTLVGSNVLAVYIFFVYVAELLVTLTMYCWTAVWQSIISCGRLEKKWLWIIWGTIPAFAWKDWGKPCKLHSGNMVSMPGLTLTFQIWSRSATHWTVIFIGVSVLPTFQAQLNTVLLLTVRN